MIVYSLSREALLTLQDEDLFVCVWTRDEATKDPLLAVAGRNAVIKVINTRTETLVATFSGHGDVHICPGTRLMQGNLRFESIPGASLYYWQRC